jgi:hypothetical protein
MLEMHRHMVEERHHIWLARQNGAPQPWTEDPVLANRKFTNMFRVLDPGSQFVFDLWSERAYDLMARLVFYRLTNLPRSWYEMKAVLGRWPVAYDFTDRPEMLVDILQQRRRDGWPVFSGAYIIVPEPGTKNDKIEGAVRVTANFLKYGIRDFLDTVTQEARFKALRSTPGLGKFLSMQILTDWGYLQQEEPDLSFIVAGPGAVRGAALLNPDMSAEDVIYDLAVEWFDDPYVRLSDRGLTVMDVQNTLCEFGKYAREIESPRKKSIYKPAHPGAQPQPVLPLWW